MAKNRGKFAEQKGLKVLPWGNKIQLDFPTTTAGALRIDPGYSILERGTVIALGPTLMMEANPRVKVGDQMLIKTWDVDVITVGEEKYYFISEDSRAICAIVE